MRDYSTADVAKRLSSHPNTIRDWTRRYGDILSQRANNPKRKYTEDDLSILATIADYRDKGISFEAITDILNEGTRINPDEIPPPVTLADEQARDSVEIMHIPQDKYLLEQSELRTTITYLTNELDKTQQALVSTNDKNDVLQDKVVDLQGALSVAEAKLEIIESERKPADYWIEQERKTNADWLDKLANERRTAILIALALVVVLGILGYVLFVAPT